MARRRWWLSAVFGIAAFAAAPGAAIAAESVAEKAIAVRVHETLHPGCPTEPSIFDRLKGHLPNVREARPDEQAIDLDLRTEVQDRLSFGTLTIVIGEAHDERTASSVSCADVLSALSMMAAIVIGEDSRASMEATPPIPVEQSRPRPRPRPARHARPPHENRRVRWSLGAGAEVDGNRGGNVLLGRWFVGARLPLRFDPTLRLGLARSTRGLLTSSRGVVSIQWSEVTFDACADIYRTSYLTVGPCFDGEAGWIDSSVVDPLPSRRSSHLWLTAGASGKVSWHPVGPLSVELSIGLRAPIPRSELFFEPDRTVIYRSPVVIPAVMAGIVAHLPD